MYPSISIYLSKCVSLFIYLSTYLPIFIYLSECILCMYVCMHVCIYVCIYIYLSICSLISIYLVGLSGCSGSGKSTLLQVIYSDIKRVNPISKDFVIYVYIYICICV